MVIFGLILLRETMSHLIFHLHELLYVAAVLWGRLVVRVIRVMVERLQSAD